jgi:transposase-like protein
VSVVQEAYVWLDATFLKVRQEGRVVSTVVVIAIVVTATRDRGVLGLDMDPSLDGSFWLQFFRCLVSRGLKKAEPESLALVTGRLEAIPLPLAAAR